MGMIFLVIFKIPILVRQARNDDSNPNEAMGTPQKRDT